jgi:hypothetical protein
LTSRYRKWITHVFDRPVTDKGWYFDCDDVEFAAEDSEVVALITATLRRCGEDLARFANLQVSHGLNFIVNDWCSNTVLSLMADSVPKDVRLEAIASIRSLYCDCFERRCASVLGYLGEAGGGPLNTTCYMLWDISPLGYWEGRPEKALFYDAVLDLLEVVLYSKNDACLESALHGLGHMQMYASKRRVAVIIGRLLEQRKDLRPEIERDAQNAATGHIQ